MAFFEGALTYKDIKNMPMSEFLRLQDIANEIGKERKAEIEKAKNG